MKKYVARGTIIHNGTLVEHMKNFKRLEEVYRKEVQLMSGAGTIDVTPLFKFSIDYVPPKVGAKLDWSDVEDDTFVIELKGGKRISYSGVECLSVGETTVDGENEAVMTITFIAKSRDMD